jgi:hypothetical protein
MGQFDNAAELIALARGIDLYARRHRIIFALDVGEYDKALRLCEGALAECEQCLPTIPGPADSAAHREKLAALQDFAGRLAAVAQASSQAAA